MSTSQVSSTRDIYDTRSSEYDDSWHPIHAANYIRWTSPQPGQHILDLACGTGLVTLLAKRAVGPTGTVTGVDISTGMMAVGKEKAAKEKLDIEWLEWDITNMQEAKEQGKIRRDGYDLITCATALVLLDDPGKAIKQWATLLKPGGRLITDVPTETTSIEGIIFEELGRELNFEVPCRRGWVTGDDSLKRVFERARLEIERAWRAEGVEAATALVGDAEQAGKSFDRLVEWEMWAEFGKEGIRERARRGFIDRIKESREKGMGVGERDAFYMAIGRPMG